MIVLHGYHNAGEIVARLGLCSYILGMSQNTSILAGG